MKPPSLEASVKLHRAARQLVQVLANTRAEEIEIMLACKRNKTPSELVCATALLVLTSNQCKCRCGAAVLRESGRYNELARAEGTSIAVVPGTHSNM